MRLLRLLAAVAAAAACAALTGCSLAGRAVAPPIPRADVVALLPVAGDLGPGWRSSGLSSISPLPDLDADVCLDDWRPLLPPAAIEASATVSIVDAEGTTNLRAAALPIRDPAATLENARAELERCFGVVAVREHVTVDGGVVEERAQLAATRVESSVAGFVYDGVWMADLELYGFTTAWITAADALVIVQIRYRPDQPPTLDELERLIVVAADAATG